MIRSPILKVLSTLTSHRVRYLLMGGQACVLYGAAEFSRDTDVAVLAATDNLDRLSAALRELQAERIAVPPLAAEHLERGLAVHFRCRHPEAEAMRLDVMSVMRGADPFDDLWQRRTTVELESGTSVEVMALPDLVTIKKTQRDKDWPMIRRLVEGHYARHRESPTPQQVAFWLLECRTPDILRRVAGRHFEEATALVEQRSLLSSAIAGDEEALRTALAEEEHREREADRRYWEPLRRELERLRREERSG